VKFISINATLPGTENVMSSDVLLATVYEKYELELKKGLYEVTKSNLLRRSTNEGETSKDTDDPSAVVMPTRKASKRDPATVDVLPTLPAFTASVTLVLPTNLGLKEDMNY
jgi:hypothetical protein